MSSVCMCMLTVFWDSHEVLLAQFPKWEKIANVNPTVTFCVSFGCNPMKMFRLKESRYFVPTPRYFVPRGILL